MAGDELHWGDEIHWPTSIVKDDNCISCWKTVTHRQEAVQCDECDRWCHRKCGTEIPSFNLISMSFHISGMKPPNFAGRNPQLFGTKPPWYETSGTGGDSDSRGTVIHQFLLYFI